MVMFADLPTFLESSRLSEMPYCFSFVTVRK